MRAELIKDSGQMTARSFQMEDGQALDQPQAFPHWILHTLSQAQAGTLWGQGDRFNPGPFLADAMQPHDFMPWSSVRAKLLDGMKNCKYKNSR